MCLERVGVYYESQYHKIVMVKFLFFVYCNVLVFHQTSSRLSYDPYFCKSKTFIVLVVNKLQM